MSSKANHRKRSHRSHGRTVGALGMINKTAWIRGSDTYVGKPLAVRLRMFRQGILQARESDARRRAKCYGTCAYCEKCGSDESGELRSGAMRWRTWARSRSDSENGLGEMMWSTGGRQAGGGESFISGKNDGQKAGGVIDSCGPPIISGPGAYT
jgi:hypothetical protein